MHRLSRHIFEVTSMRAQCESNVMARTVRVATQNGFKLTFVLPVLNRVRVNVDNRDDVEDGDWRLALKLDESAGIGTERSTDRAEESKE